MEKELQGSIRFGAVSDTRGDGYVSIELEDNNSGIQFLEIKLSHEEFGRLVGTNGSVDCKYTVRGAENIGKVYDHKKGTIKVPADVYRKLTTSVKYDDQKEKLGQWLKQNAKEEGWHISAYLGSRGSIVGSGSDGEPVTLNFTYFRYVDQKQNASNG